MRAALFVPLLLSGCAQILAEADGQRARIDVTSDSFARVVFCVGDFVEKRRAGSCQLLDRSTLGAHDPRPNSGPIRIAASGQPVVLSPQYHGIYRDGERQKQPLWQPGDTVVVTAPGASAPAFRIELPAPIPIEPIDPPAQDPNERGPDIWALRDLPLRWQPVENAKLVLQLIEVLPMSGTDRAGAREGPRHIRCEFDARLGAAVVPQTLIADMPVGSAVLYISSIQERTVDVSGWQFRVRLYTDAIRERHAFIDARPPKGPGEE